jgi:deoxycytidylate deaminase
MKSSLTSNIIDMAILAASRSVMTHQHGAVLFDGRDVVATGYNHLVGSSGMCSCHAEASVIKQYVERVYKGL